MSHRKFFRPDGGIAIFCDNTIVEELVGNNANVEFSKCPVCGHGFKTLGTGPGNSKIEEDTHTERIDP